MKIAIYSRKSKFTGKGESIENQIQMCKEYVNNNLKDKSVTEFFVYEDEGFSGGNTNRPEFQRLMEDARAKKFDVLICYRLDRISRNVADFSTTLETLQKYDIDFISIKEQFDTSSPMGRAMIYIASVFAQLERETIAERVKDNMLELSKTGRWLGGIAPIGYESTPITYYDHDMNEKKMFKLSQIPEELKIVKLIFDKYLEFKSLSKVETYLLQNDIKTKKGNDFSKSNLRVVLTNTVYVKATDEVMNYLEQEGMTTCGAPDGKHGLLSYNKSKTIINENGKITRKHRDKSDWIVAVSSQTGIIEAKDWLEVQRILLKNRDTFPNLGRTHNALLTGKLKCKKCDGLMGISHGHISKKTGDRLFYYACNLKKFSKGSRCDCKNAKVAEVDAAMKLQLKEFGLNQAKLLKRLSEQLKKAKENNSGANQEDNIKKAIAEKERQIESLLNKLSLDDDIAELIVGKIKNLKTELSELKSQLSNINNIKNEQIENELNISLIKMILDKCSIVDTLEDEEIKQLIDVFIEDIYWDDETNSIKVNIIGSKGSKKK